MECLRNNAENGRQPCLSESSADSFERVRKYPAVIRCRAEYWAVKKFIFLLFCDCSSYSIMMATAVIGAFYIIAIAPASAFHDDDNSFLSSFYVPMTLGMLRILNTFTPTKK